MLIKAFGLLQHLASRERRRKAFVVEQFDELQPGAGLARNLRCFFRYRQGHLPGGDWCRGAQSRYAALATKGGRPTH